MAGSTHTAPSSGPPNPEKRDSVSQNQNDDARLERIEKFIQGDPKIFARKVRELLDNLHRPRNQRRLSRRLQAQVRSSLRQATTHLKELCARWGINLKGFEFRGARKGLAHYVEANARAVHTPPPAIRPIPT